MGSAFQVAADDVEATGGPHLSAWGQAAAGQFDGRDGSLSLHGTVLTAALGADAAWEHVLTGVALAYSYGGGGFSHPQADGDLAGTLISVHPYVALALSDRIRFWGTAGYGFGRLDLSHDRSLSTDLSMLTGAMGRARDAGSATARAFAGGALRCPVAAHEHGGSRRHGGQ